MVKLVIFDLDGTLLDSFDSIIKSFEMATKAFGVDIDLNVVKDNIGIPSKEILRRALRVKVSEQSIKEILTLRRKLHDKLVMNAKLFDDVLPTLTELKRRGLKLALVSSNVKYRLKAILEKNKLTHLFDSVVSYEDVKRPKPHPDMVLKALEEVGVKAEEAILVGDSINDVMSAKSAGVIAVLIDRFGIKKNIGEDFRVTSLKELFKLIEELDC